MDQDVQQSKMLWQCVMKHQSTKAVDTAEEQKASQQMMGKSMIRKKEVIFKYHNRSTGL